MLTTVITPTIVKPELAPPSWPSPKKRGLVATWSMVNGKLTCKWSVMANVD
jgi:hypothetical protein